MVIDMNQEKKEIRLEFDAISENEALARVVIAAFLTQLDPTLEELQDVKTAVSEAVTNAIIHAYQENGGKIVMQAILIKDEIEIWIEDYGIGIENVQKAMEPLYTTSSETERAGMGFAFMEAFMDKLEVQSTVGVGTKICMRKKFYPLNTWKNSQV